MEQLGLPFGIHPEMSVVPSLEGAFDGVSAEVALVQVAAPGLGDQSQGIQLRPRKPSEDGVQEMRMAVLEQCHWVSSHGVEGFWFVFLFWHVNFGSVTYLTLVKKVKLL